MTIKERNDKLKHLITCMKCEVSCKYCDENYPTQYDAGNMGEIIENLEEISKILEQEPFMNKPCISAGVCEHDKLQLLDKIRAEIKVLSPEPTAFDVVDGNPIKDAVWETIADVVTIIDKYRNGE